MARKPPSSKNESKVMTPGEQRASIGRLEARIKELRELDVSGIRSGDDPPVEGLEHKIRATLANIYGEQSAEYDRLRGATSLDATTYAIVWGDGPGTSVQEIQEGVERGRQRAIAILQGEVDSLKEHLQFSAPAAAAQNAVPVEPAALSNEVFIVHGRDEAAKETVARVIQRAGLKPIILHEQANGGKTIIEKFEKASRCRL
jgi:hypothetical protein